MNGEFGAALKDQKPPQEKHPVRESLNSSIKFKLNQAKTLKINDLKIGLNILT
jgi:hypothetical protein